MRFGLFGTGYWALHTHGAALAAHSGVELVGVWGRDGGKAAEVAAALGPDVKGYADAGALIEDVDAIAVALPPQVQAPIAIRAAAAGRHLLLDKPLALTVADADEVVRAVAGTGVASVVFFTSRFDPVVAEALDAARATGGWSSARVTMYGSIFGTASPYAQSQWRREYGGLWDIGPHALARVLPVLGPARRVSAVFGAHDTSFVLVEHDGGAVSQLALTLDAPPAAMSFQSVLYGESGIVELPGGSIDAVTAFGNAIDALAIQVRTGRSEHPCDVRFARDVVRILAAAQTAALAGAAQDLA